MEKSEATSPGEVRLAGKKRGGRPGAINIIQFYQSLDGAPGCRLCLALAFRWSLAALTYPFAKTAKFAVAVLQSF